jgi:hypothetical protein
MGAWTLDLLPTLDDIDVWTRSTHWIPISRFQQSCALGSAGRGENARSVLEKASIVRQEV